MAKNRVRAHTIIQSKAFEPRTQLTCPNSSADALGGDPEQQRLGNELRTIIAAQKDRRAALADQARQHFDHARRTDATVYVAAGL
jgi:hypothetical protein